LLAFKVLQQDWYKCSGVYIQNRVNVRKEIYTLMPGAGPNPKCYVCGDKPEIGLKIDLEKMTVKMLGDKVLKKELCMIEPDVEISDGTGTILISSEEGETGDIGDKLLKDFNIKHGTRLTCDDFRQNYNLMINIFAMNEEELGRRDKSVECFEIIGDRSQLGPKEEEVPSSSKKMEIPKRKTKRMTIFWKLLNLQWPRKKSRSFLRNELLMLAKITKHHPRNENEAN